jgi:hypothetical protein
MHMAMGSCKGLSIGYDVLKSSPRDDGGRNLREVKVWEVSLVTMPMNERAKIGSMKSFMPALASLNADDLDDEDLGDLESINRYLKRLLPVWKAAGDGAEQMAQLQTIDEAPKKLAG